MITSQVTMEELVQKYNVAAPRYTSYPTVPFWDNEAFSRAAWTNQVYQTFQQSKEKGISLYIHLPFCESLCTYCGCNTRITKNHRVEEPYIASLLKEWEMYVALFKGERPLLAEIHLGGGTPTFFHPDNLKVLIEGILKHADLAPDRSFSFEAHPANTTVTHLETLFDLGFRRLSLGIQDFDPLVQFVINRHQTSAEVKEVMLNARKIGFESINFDLIYGLPKQTLATVEDTIQKAMLLGPDRISFYSYAHVPWIKPGQRHYTEADLPHGAAKLALYNLGKKMILAHGYEDVGMDHFAKREDELFVAFQQERLHRNFMGYADRFSPLLIGIGVSSISDAWGAFAQNVKTVEEYHKLIDVGVLPVIKGHILNEEDLLVRRYILDMMCKGKVQLPTGAPLNEQIIDELSELVADGLVSISGDLIQCTAIGRSFLRNICMAFDQRLLRSKAQNQLFSQAI
ncbi:oxygen-independent coproporphyrinogen III oxidase [Sphingobacterium siyangense]|uniref:oxygen-independent coproporphyrinogen III oxidase n=1 Tax=Sphingobacterium siyangense TaxID=459529 RepID=UPI001966B11D|nr:oxygen-independent coproporphyrinogen III oxidase [Sphingobacterium siyangense]QRY56915.1 oxygen-independent coproporphyrinogen III oxidase [Sphingobacterium siyangense]